MHDALVMLGFDAVFRVEIDAGTIAAILTILGYSINDTIVNFDRARENNSSCAGRILRTILDTSVSQTLGRTFITSGATLLTVIALFILTTGSIKNFALNMIVGIVEGTYSTFISAFIVIEWSNWRDKKRKAGDLAKYGIASPRQARRQRRGAGAHRRRRPLETKRKPTRKRTSAEEPVPGQLATESPWSPSTAGSRWPRCSRRQPQPRPAKSRRRSSGSRARARTRSTEGGITRIS